MKSYTLLRYIALIIIISSLIGAIQDVKHEYKDFYIIMFTTAITLFILALIIKVIQDIKEYKE